MILADDLFVFLQLMVKIGQNYDVIFPLIDILRLGMLNYSVSQYLCGKFRSGIYRGYFFGSLAPPCGQI